MLKSIDFDVSGLALENPTQNRSRMVKRIDFDVSGLALDGPNLKTSPGGLKASILMSAGLLWKTPKSKQAPES